MKQLCILAIALTPICLPAASLFSLDLDPAKTEVQFTLHDVLHTVHGSFKLKQGSIHFDPDSGKASGEIIVDVTSGASGSGARDRRMHKEILESQRYPDATFTPDHVDGGMKNPSNFVLKVDDKVEMDIKTTTAMVMYEYI
jgi:polyisoprenoid-binding protein YceI